MGLGFLSIVAEYTIRAREGYAMLCGCFVHRHGWLLAWFLLVDVSLMFDVWEMEKAGKDPDLTSSYVWYYLHVLST